MVPVRAILAMLSLTTSVAAQARPLPQPPGRLIDIGGRRLHLLCSGAGTTTVVLEAGASSFAIDWTLVQRDVSRTNRTCSYDRAGMGWSDPTTPENRATAAHDLHTLLERAGEKGPFVMVGASRGGMLVRAYQLEYPDDVAGFVFVDPASEDRLFTMLNGEAVLIAKLNAEQLATTFPKTAVRVPRRSPQRGAPFDKLPPDLYQVRVQLDEQLIASLPDSVSAEIVASSQERERAFLARLLATRQTPSPLGSRPTVVLTRGDERDEGREAVHATLAGLSTNSRHSVVVGAGHEIHLFEPSAVVTAIADVVRAVRERSALPARPAF